MQYYQFLRLGFDGYKRVMRHTVDNASLLRKKLVDSGYFTIMNETQRIPVVALTLDKKVKNFNEFDVSNKVREKGWVLSAYSMPPNAQEVTSLRIVVRPHINRNMAETLSEDVINACDWLSKNGGNAKPPVLHHAIEKEELVMA